MKLRIIVISDTHEMHRQVVVPDGDILIHAGDFTMDGTLSAIGEFNAWLGTLPHEHKIVIAGNHDWAFQRQPVRARVLLTNATYLQDTAVAIDGLTVYGSPWQPWFNDWAFNLMRGPEIARRWALIPLEADILITHGPPFSLHDRNVNGNLAGCEDLLCRVRQINPQIHIFGHIHEGYGVSTVGQTTFINASICDECYRPKNRPVVCDL